jgi:DNA-binding MarR family transcriptional regulator
MLYLDDQLCVQLYIKTREIIRYHEKHLRKIGMTYPKSLVLLSLHEKNPCFIDDIVTKLCLDTGTLTPLLKKLQSEGWVNRQRDLKDERRVQVSLTPVGEKIIPQIKEIFSQTASSACVTPEIKEEILKNIKHIEFKGN